MGPPSLADQRVKDLFLADRSKKIIYGAAGALNVRGIETGGRSEEKGQTQKQLTNF